VLQAIAQQHGLLIERAQGIYSFLHLTFQEYLVAKWFCEQTSLESLAKHFVKKRWREVCLLAAEVIDSDQEAAQFFWKSKEIIDMSFTDVHIQHFLEKLYQKVENSRFCLNPGIVRAFYFDIAFLRIIQVDEIVEDETVEELITPAWFNLPGSNFATLLGDFKLTLLLNDNINICFDFGFISYDPREEAFGDVCNLSQINTEDDLGLDLIFSNLLIILASFTDTDYADLLSRDGCIRASSSILKATQILSTANLKDELKEFCKEL
jgi:hypothetical protein